MNDNKMDLVEAILREVEINLELARDMEDKGQDKIGETLRWVAASQLDLLTGLTLT